MKSLINIQSIPEQILTTFQRCRLARCSIAMEMLVMENTDELSMSLLETMSRYMAESLVNKLYSCRLRNVTVGFHCATGFSPNENDLREKERN